MTVSDNPVLNDLNWQSSDTAIFRRVVVGSKVKAMSFLLTILLKRDGGWTACHVFLAPPLSSYHNLNRKACTAREFLFSMLVDGLIFDVQCFLISMASFIHKDADLTWNGRQNIYFSSV